MGFEFWFRIVNWALMLGLAAWVGRPSAKLLTKRRRAFTERTGAYLDPYFTEAFDRQTRRNYHWFAGLILAAAALEELFADLDPDPEIAPFSPYSFFAAAWLAGFAATRLRSAGREFAVPDSRTAVARPRRVVLGDYVSWPLQLATWLFLALDVALAVASLAAWRRGDVRPVRVVSGVASLSVTLAMAAFTVWFGRALCERPTPAVDPSHLYLQDAWRASSLSSAYTAVCVSAYIAFLGLVFVADIRWLDVAMGVLTYPTLGAILVVGLVQSKWFRRRLWTTLPSGYVLYPGQTIPPTSGAGA